MLLDSHALFDRRCSFFFSSFFDNFHSSLWFFVHFILVVSIWNEALTCTRLSFNKNLICCPNIWRLWIKRIWFEKWISDKLSFVVIFDTNFSYKCWLYQKIKSNSAFPWTTEALLWHFYRYFINGKWQTINIATKIASHQNTNKPQMGLGSGQGLGLGLRQHCVLDIRQKINSVS